MTAILDFASGTGIINELARHLSIASCFVVSCVDCEDKEESGDDKELDAPDGDEIEDDGFVIFIVSIVAGAVVDLVSMFKTFSVGWGLS